MTMGELWGTLTYHSTRIALWLAFRRRAVAKTSSQLRIAKLTTRFVGALNGFKSWLSRTNRRRSTNLASFIIDSDRWSPDNSRASLFIAVERMPSAKGGPVPSHARKSLEDSLTTYIHALQAAMPMPSLSNHLHHLRFCEFSSASNGTSLGSSSSHQFDIYATVWSSGVAISLAVRIQEESTRCPLFVLMGCQMLERTTTWDPLAFP